MQRVIIVLTIVFIVMASAPVSLAMADLNVPDWALFSGHIAMWLAGLICAEVGMRNKP